MEIHRTQGQVGVDRYRHFQVEGVDHRDITSGTGETAFVIRSARMSQSRELGTSAQFSIFISSHRRPMPSTGFIVITPPERALPKGPPGRPGRALRVTRARSHGWRRRGSDQSTPICRDRDTTGRWCSMMAISCAGGCDRSRICWHAQPNVNRASGESNLVDDPERGNLPRTDSAGCAQFQRSVE